MKKLLTICVIHQHPRILLGLKKRGFGVGKWNGFGGKALEGELIEDTAVREVREEAGIEVEDVERIGVCEYIWTNDPVIHEVHIFRATRFSGEPVETEEMNPQWFHVDELPFQDMWADDPYWFPLALAGKKFKAKFYFEPDERITRHELEEVEEL